MITNTQWYLKLWLLLGVIVKVWNIKGLRHQVAKKSGLEKICNHNTFASKNIDVYSIRLQRYRKYKLKSEFCFSNRHVFFTVCLPLTSPNVHKYTVSEISSFLSNDILLYIYIYIYLLPFTQGYSQTL